MKNKESILIRKAIRIFIKNHELWHQRGIEFKLYHCLLLLNKYLNLFHLSFFIWKIRITNTHLAKLYTDRWNQLCKVLRKWTSLVAQMVKHLPTMQETWVQSLGQEDLLAKEMATHSSIVAYKIPSTEQPGRLQSMG